MEFVEGLITLPTERELGMCAKKKKKKKKKGSVPRGKHTWTKIVSTNIDRLAFAESMQARGRTNETIHCFRLPFARIMDLATLDKSAKLQPIFV
jgi:hypothetical protein